MEVTNEKLYEMYTGLKTDNEKLYEVHADLRADYEKMHVETMAEIKAEFAQLRSDIAKWAVVLFVGSMAIMITILGVIIVSVV